MIDLNSLESELGQPIERQTAQAILEQLNDFISRGLIILEVTKPMLSVGPTGNTIDVTRGVNLRLKDREYIERLENEIRDLREDHRVMREALEYVQGRLAVNIAPSFVFVVETLAALKVKAVNR